MKYYRELKAYQKLQKRIAELTAFLNKQDPEFVKQHQDLMYAFTALTSKLNYLYRDVTKPRMDEVQIEGLKEAYTNAKMMLGLIKDDYVAASQAPNKNTKQFDDIGRMLDDDINTVNKLDARDFLTLPAAVYKVEKETKRADYVDGQFKWPGFYEYSRIYPTRQEDEILDEFVRKSPEEAARTYREVIEKDPHRYEYTSISGVVPPNIRNTSDIGKIHAFLAEHGGKLSYAQEVRLRKQAEVAQKVQNIEQQAVEAMNRGEEIGTKAKVRSRGPEDAHIDVHMQHQTSGNGCWSCAGQLLAASRGMGDVRQEDIRGYRPKLADDEVVVNNDDTDYAYSNDRVKNLMEMGDSVLAFAPNSMLHEVAISNYSRDIEKSGMSRENYIDNAVALMKKQILHAIKEEHSPVALLLPGHYVTITGISGDTIEYKNSSKMDADTVTKVSLKELVTKEFSKPTNDPRRLGMFQLSWLSDIKLAADQKTIHGVPSVYVEMGEDGEVKLPPDDVQSLAAGEMMSINRNGVRIHRGGRDETSHIDNSYDALKATGVQIVEKVYLPKKLNADYLRTMAGKRDPEEERKLSEADEKIYGIPKDREAARQKVEQARARFVGVAGPAAGGNQGQEHAAQAGGNQGSEHAAQAGGNQGPEHAAQAGGNHGAEHAAQAGENHQSCRLRKIRDLTRKLGKEMDKHQHFYLRSPKQEYSDMAESLARIAELADKGLASAAAKDGKFTEKDAAQMMKDMDEALRQGRRYLMLKYKELTDDPRRKTDPGKQKNEQKRIRAVLDACEELVKLKAQLSGKEPDVPLPGERVESRLRELDGFRKAMVSGQDNPKREHEATYRNRIDIPKEAMAPLNRMEAIFGIEPEYLKEFENPNYFGKEKNGGTTFRRIKTINESLPAIGEGGKNDKLSNKDFVALACAAATTRKVFAPEEEKLSNIPFADWLGKDTAFINYGNTCLETSTSLVYDHGMTPHIPAVERSRNMAKDAMLQYKNGNKKPLAELISEGITNMVRSSRKGMLWAAETNLYFSEMCQRMTAMLDRDPDLMKQALHAGLDPQDMKYIRSMEQQGMFAAKEKQLYGTFPELSEPERMEWYTDYMTSMLLNETRYMDKKQMEADQTYREKLNGLHDSCERRWLKDEDDLIKEFGTRFQKDPGGKQIYEAYQKEVREALKNAAGEYQVMDAKKDVNAKYIEKMSEYAKAQADFAKNYQNALLGRRKDALDKMDEERIAQKKQPMTEKERLDAAIAIEKNEVERYRVADSSQEREQFDRQKQELSIFLAVKDEADAFLGSRGNLPGRREDVMRIRLNLENELQAEHMPKSMVREAIADPDMVQQIRDKAYAYVKGNELYKLGSRDFCRSFHKDGAFNQDLLPGLGVKVDSYIKNQKKQRQLAKQNPQAGVQNPQTAKQEPQADVQEPQAGVQNPHAAKQNPQAQRARSNTARRRDAGKPEEARPRANSTGGMRNGR